MKRFKKVYIEITNICNLKCSFCQVSHKKQRSMSAAEFSTVLDAVKPYTDYLYLHVKGEPLAHPEFEKIIDLTHEKGFIVNITTNGTLINKTGRFLKGDNIRVINFSLHSYSDPANNVEYEEKLYDVIRFIKEGLISTKSLYTIRFWNLTGDPAFDNVTGRNRQILEIIEREFGLDYKINEVVTPGKSVKIAERVFIHYDAVFQWPDMSNEDAGTRGFCYGLRDQAAILCDGTVVPCCLDGEGVIALGNIFHEDFGKIISSERSTALYNGFSGNLAVEPLCIKCSFKNRFSSKLGSKH